MNKQLENLQEYLSMLRPEVQKLLGLIDNPRFKEAEWALSFAAQSRVVATVLGFKEDDNGPV